MAEKDMFDSFGAGEETKDMFDSMAPVASKDKSPVATIRNKAAAIALMSGGDPSSVYQNVRSAAESGTPVSQTPEAQAVQNMVGKNDIGGIMSVLGDPNVPQEQKLAAIRNYQKPSLINSTSGNLMSQALAADNPGETDSEEKARLNLSERMVESLRQRQVAQGIVNQFMISRDPSTAKAVGEFFKSSLVPGFSSEVAARMEEGGLWDKFKAFWAPGSAIKGKQEKLLELDAKEAAILTQGLVEKLKDMDGFLIDDEDTYNKLDYIQMVASGEVLSTPEVILENIQPWLSVFGLAVDSARVGSKARLILRNRRLADISADERRAIEIADSVSKARPAPDTSILSTVSKPDEATIGRNAKIASLEEEKAALLGDNNLAAPGDIRNMEGELAGLAEQGTSASDIKVLAKQIQKANPRMSAKEARDEAVKRINDYNTDVAAKRSNLEGQIAANKEAAPVAQRIAAIEKEIEALQKGKGEFTPSGLNAITAELRAVEWNQTIRADLPASVGNIVGAANPSIARNLFKAVVDAPDDEVAKAIYGTTKVDAIVANVAPQIVSDTGKVTSKAPFINSASARFLLQGESLGFTNKEYAQAIENAEKNFRNTSALVPNEAMGGIKVDVNGSVMEFDAVYGKANGGFASAEDAMATAKYALARFGVKEENVEILASNGVSHLPVKLEDVKGVEGNYFVRVKVPYDLTFNDITNPEKLDVRLNFLDGLTPTLWADSGQASRWLVDSASMLHPTLTGAAVRAVDLGAAITKDMLYQVEKFTKKMDSFSKERQSIINDYLYKQNKLGIPDDPNYLATNFSPDEIDAIKAFRDYWDSHWFLENRSVVLNLKASGWQAYDNNGTFLVAKPVHENFRRQVASALDVNTGAVVRLSEKEVEDLYNAKGYFAKLRRPEKFGNTATEHVIVRNNPNEYLRALSDTDNILNKRPSYYQVHYKAPKFVDLVKRDVDGSVLERKTVAVANDTGEAEQWIKSQPTPASGYQYESRSDKKLITTSSDEWWDLNEAGGRMATRHRGKPLNEAGAITNIGEGDYIVNPVDSAVRAARSIGEHTALSPAIAGMKERFIQQYGRFLRPDGYGGKKFPSSFAEIGETGAFSSKELRDARTTWGYIRFLENGQVNALDSVVQQVLGFGADLAGKRGFNKTERLLNRGAATAPAGFLKSLVFKALIAAHPIRQALIQAHQTVRLLAYNPKGSTSGSIAKLASEAAKDFVMQTHNSDFTRFIRESGMLDAVTESNLIRDVTANYVDHSQKVLRGIGKPFELAQRAGFVWGEQFSAVLHLAGVYDLYKRRGLDITNPRIRSQAFSEARAIMGDMNKAGDMPYNQNWASVVMQFAQVPHKMLLQVTNRRIPLKERAKLVAGDLLFWGLPVALIQNDITEELVPDPALRQKLIDGLEMTALNAALHNIFDDTYSVDTSSFSPNDMSGIFAMFDALFSEGTDEVLLNSPAGKLFGEQGRAQHAMHMVGRYFRGFVDKDIEPLEFMTVASEVAKVFSGFNDFQKAMIIKEFGEIRDTKGNVLQNNVPEYAQWFQYFGLGSRDVKWMYETLKKVSKEQKAQKEEWRKSYDEVMKVYQAHLGVGQSDPKFWTAYTGALLLQYKDNIAAQQQIMKWAREDGKDPNLKLYERLGRAAGFVESDSLRRLVETSPLKEEQKQLLYSNINAYSYETMEKEE